LATHSKGPAIDPAQWNRYEIVASGERIRTFINGIPWLDVRDGAGARRGIIALKLPAGAGEVRLKDLRLELNQQ
jgi:hypothetical protein